MNTNFYKLLKFEIKQNYIHWVICALLFISITTLISVKDYINHTPFLLKGSFIPLLFLFSGLITLFSYSESTSRQSMIMYHLLPVSRNTKFFTKQLFTFIAAPLLLLLFYLILALVVNPLVNGEFKRSAFSPNLQPHKIAILFLWSHSWATFFAVLFKKRKLLFVILTYFGFQFLLMIAFFIWQFAFQSFGASTPSFAFLTSSSTTLFWVAGMLIPAILYIISYRLFFKRQL